MKNFRVFLAVVLAIAGVLVFTQCKKDHLCRMRVNCFYSTNGMDKDTLCPFANISFDISKYSSGIVDTNISKIQDQLTDAQGVYEYVLDYPALLIVKATKVDTIKDPETDEVVDIKRYVGTTQVQVNEGELTEKDILLIETN